MAVFPETVGGSQLYHRRVRLFLGNETHVDSVTKSTETKTVDGKTTSQILTTTNSHTNGILIENLRVQFKVKKTLKKAPNTCEVQVTNLAASTRAQLQKGHVKIVLEAGYDDNLAHLFAGDSRFVDQLKEGPDWVTKVQLGDGERHYTYRRVAKSFSPGVKVAEVIKQVAKSMGLTVTGLNYVAGIAEDFTQGFTAYGKVATELDRLLQGRGLEWSIQDGQLQILPIGGTTSESIFLLSPTTGLVGSPEHGNPEKEVPLTPDEFTVTASKKRGPPILKVKSLLQPALRPGRRVRIKAQSLDEKLFRIQTVTHTGDTHGGEWYSELECIAVGG